MAAVQERLKNVQLEDAGVNGSKRAQDLERSDSASSANHDVTRPGYHRSRTLAMRKAEEHGGVPIIFNPLLNKGTSTHARMPRYGAD